MLVVVVGNVAAVRRKDVCSDMVEGIAPECWVDSIPWGRLQSQLMRSAGVEFVEG